MKLGVYLSSDVASFLPYFLHFQAEDLELLQSCQLAFFVCGVGWEGNTFTKPNVCSCCKGWQLLAIALETLFLYCARLNRSRLSLVSSPLSSTVTTIFPSTSVCQHHPVHTVPTLTAMSQRHQKFVWRKTLTEDLEKTSFCYGEFWRQLFWRKMCRTWLPRGRVNFWHGADHACS